MTLPHQSRSSPQALGLRRFLHRSPPDRRLPPLPTKPFKSSAKINFEFNEVADLLETGTILSRIDVLGPVDRPGIHWIGIEQTCPGTTSGHIPSHQAYGVSHYGPYDHLGDAWFTAHTHTHTRAKKHKCPKAGPFPYEIYVTEPDTEPSTDIRTDIFIPIQ